MGSAHSVLATLGLPLLMAYVLSQSTLLRLQVALQRNCLRWALGCVHFYIYTAHFQVLGYSTKAQTSAGPEFCALPRSKQLMQPGAWQAHSSQLDGASYHLPGPSLFASWLCSGSTVSGVPCVSSGVLISGCDPPDGCQPFRISGRLGWQLEASQFGRGCRLWGQVRPFPFGSGCCPPASLPLAGDGPVCSQLTLLWYGSVLCSVSGWQCLRLELSMGKFSLSLFPLWLSHSLGCYLMLAPSDCPQGIQAQSLP